MNNVQRVLFDLLCEFDQICRKYNIIYYLAAGSNLGALRHEGFIPWDDDVDVHMSRHEYEKLEKIIDKELADNRELVSYKRYKNYISPIPRYTAIDTTLLVRSRMVDETPHGIFLDIIILDPMPKAHKDVIEWSKKHYVYCELLEYTRISAARKSDWEFIDIELYKKYEKRCAKEGRQ